MRSGVAERSRKAVDVAGTREKRAPVESAGTWRIQRGKLSAEQAKEPFRPGKTSSTRRHG